MIQQLVPWQGSKRRLAKHILPIFENLPHTCYVEPFAGSAAMLFAREPAKFEVLNDINRDLVTLFRVVAHHPDEFMRQFQWALSSREMFKWAQMQSVESLTDIQRASRFFFLQRLCFGGKVEGRNFGTSTTASPRFNRQRVEKMLTEVHLRLSSVTVECLPWADCMSRYDRPHTLFFCDPPYWKLEGYGTRFGIEEYERLAFFLANLRGKAVVTVNDHPRMRDVFKGFKTRTLATTYVVGGKGRGREKDAKELVIIRD